MLKFNYTGNHKEDEAYMQQMCAEGWAAIKLVEGFWTFERCTPGQYVYRVAYMRGRTAEEFLQFRSECAQKGIEFVSKYSFWAIFRSEKPFEFYKGQDEIDICEKIYHPMPVGAVLSLIVLLIMIYLTLRVSRLFLIADIPVFIYGAVCVRCGLSYHTLLKKFKQK